MKPMAAMPAATAPCTPKGESSMTAQRFGSAPIRSAANRKISGAGFPRATMEEENMFSPKYGASPVTDRLWWIRSSEEDEATQRGLGSRSRNGLRPAIGCSLSVKSAFTSSHRPPV